MDGGSKIRWNKRIWNVNLLEWNLQTFRVLNYSNKQGVFVIVTIYIENWASSPLFSLLCLLIFYRGVFSSFIIPEFTFQFELEIINEPFFVRNPIYVPLWIGFSQEALFPSLYAHFCVYRLIDTWVFSPLPQLGLFYNFIVFFFLNV